MNPDLRELYQEVILDHNKNPRNQFLMENATASAQGFNPLCGDKMTVYLKLKHEQVEDISFLGCGCAISQASASMMTEMIKHKSVKEAHTLFHRFHDMVTKENSRETTLDKLTVLAGVKVFPARVKCATLAWHTLEAALNKETEAVSTE